VTIRRTFAALAVALFALAGCTENAEAPLSPAGTERSELLGLNLNLNLNSLLLFVGTPNLLQPRHAEKYIVASEGGFVELNGYRVDIPAGALPYSTTVTIDLPTDLLGAKRLMAEFGPHGTAFNTPVTLTFPLGGVLWNGNPIEVARWENGAWTGLGGSVSPDGLRLTGQTPHFSTYGGKYVLAGG
jgi:hypothetical protein